MRSVEVSRTSVDESSEIRGWGLPLRLPRHYQRKIAHPVRGGEGVLDRSQEEHRGGFAGVWQRKRTGRDRKISRDPIDQIQDQLQGSICIAFYGAKRVAPSGDTLRHEAIARVCGTDMNIWIPGSAKPPQASCLLLVEHTILMGPRNHLRKPCLSE